MFTLKKGKMLYNARANFESSRSTLTGFGTKITNQKYSLVLIHLFRANEWENEEKYTTFARIGS